jgi:dipeptidyl aminopeptidase/acylaminoacyl peptidase
VCLFAAFWLSVDGRDRELGRRLPDQPGSYRAANPVGADAETLFIANSGFVANYGVTALRDNTIAHHSYTSADVLALASADRPSSIYVELAGESSSIQRIDQTSLIPDPSFEIKGERPSISPDGRWLAWIERTDDHSSLWRRDISSQAAPEELLADASQILDTTVTADGDVIAVAGNRYASGLIRIKRADQVIAPIAEISGAIRYPSISPDGARLAFTRREHGSWHLFIRTLANGQELRVTDGSCNAFTPSWEGSLALLYASDCGRGWTLGAINRVSISPK